jgi:RNA-directed DNA polymerase
MFAAFLPAVSKDALKKTGEEIRSWRVHRRTATELQDLADWLNPVVRGWVAYYGRYYGTGLNSLLRRINACLVRWARRKYKRLRTYKKARRWWEGLIQRQPQLFAHWAGNAEFQNSLKTRRAE